MTFGHESDLKGLAEYFASSDKSKMERLIKERAGDSSLLAKMIAEYLKLSDHGKKRFRAAIRQIDNAC